jgi:hypothetical protein
VEKEGLFCRQYKTKKEKHCDAERLLTQSTTAEEEIEVMDQLAVEQLQCGTRISSAEFQPITPKYQQRTGEEELCNDGVGRRVHDLVRGEQT